MRSQLWPTTVTQECVGVSCVGAGLMVNFLFCFIMSFVKYTVSLVISECHKIPWGKIWQNCLHVPLSWIWAYVPYFWIGIRFMIKIQTFMKLPSTYVELWVNVIFGNSPLVRSIIKLSSWELWLKICHICLTILSLVWKPSSVVLWVDYIIRKST